MARLIQHRVNRIADLQKLSPGLGAEIDLRSVQGEPGKMILSHDPWKAGDSFEAWLEVYRSAPRGTLILNTKEDGLESRALELVTRAGIQDFFFLDTALPTLRRWTRQEKRSEFAIRISQIEPLEAAQIFAKRAAWAWLDCFDREPLAPSVVDQAAGLFQTCLVSPELQGGTDAELPRFLEAARRVSAICTKVPERWKALLEG